MLMRHKISNSHTYIIAEAGQNHNGSFEKAKWLIDIAALKIGHGKKDNIFSADAIKFTKRDMSEELTKKAYIASYENENSYGKTYGEHRENLELEYEEHAELFLYAKKKGLDFIETLCSPKTLRLLDYFRPDYIKVASRDIDNFMLLEYIRDVDIPIIISTGMSEIKEVEEAVFYIREKQKDITILHCVSKYPAQYEDLNLQSIQYMNNHFHGEHVIGFSDHTNGVLASSLAVMMGAKVIEKHITYNRQAKGTDHQGSMDQEGFARVIRDIRNTELSRGEFKKVKPQGIENIEKKLRRYIFVKDNLKAGHILKKNDLIMLSSTEYKGSMYSANMIDNLINKKLITDKSKCDSITCFDIEEANYL